MSKNSRANKVNAAVNAAVNGTSEYFTMLDELLAREQTKKSTGGLTTERDPKVSWNLRGTGWRVTDVAKWVACVMAASNPDKKVPYWVVLQYVLWQVSKQLGTGTGTGKLSPSMTCLSQLTCVDRQINHGFSEEETHGFIPGVAYTTGVGSREGKAVVKLGKDGLPVVNNGNNLPVEMQLAIAGIISNVPAEVYEKAATLEVRSSKGKNARSKAMFSGSEMDQASMADVAKLLAKKLNNK